ncbi:glycoside hydrolase family 32 protein [Bacillus salinus]|uniref:glycoside hydrolase family 32 protein n=1 Tax=Bacillus sp. HMF5848 TaxID=2495421 RepID=UPI00163AA901|nr:sucrose-6-phosphate hydrolase [Bacillus sp. HMF5848]
MMIINNKFRHTFHLMPKYGWMNDPNGFSEYNGIYHLFYQYYPYGTEWGPMHWAHAVSEDLITWKHLDIALAPSLEFDRNGIFSGSALQVGNEHWLYYTGHTDTYLDKAYDPSFKKIEEEVKEDQPIIRQVQCLATSKDGENYTKLNKPVIGTEQLPKFIKPEDFRDPKVWMHHETFYMVVGAKSVNDEGHVLFFQSSDGLKWDYLNNLSLGREYGTVWECPDLFELDGKHVLMFSPQFKPRMGHKFENVYSTMALIGSFNYESGEFTIESEKELDQGFDYYATQSLLNSKGERITVAWMNMWLIKYPLHEGNHGWNGSMTLPRVLSCENGVLKQNPIKEIEKYRKNKISHHEMVIDGELKNEHFNGYCQEFEMKIDMSSSTEFEIRLYESEDERFIIKLDKKNSFISMNRFYTKLPSMSTISPHDFTRSCPVQLDDKVTLRIFVDVSSVEVFINDGEEVMTSLFFSEKHSDAVVFASIGKTVISEFNKYEIEVK